MDWSELGDKLTNSGERIGRSLKALFGARNERLVRTLAPLVVEVSRLEAWAKGLDAAAFKAKTAEWKAAVAAGTKTLDDILPEAFALAREAAVRTLGLRPYDVQIVGGIVLHRGMIAEMYTGEGKTLVATLPLYLNALSGRPVYLVTVNDYLAKRDSEWMGPIYRYLGLACGAIQSPMSAQERLPIYHGDIVYGTNSEFGFDYLRDNMKGRVEDQVQRHLEYAIIDEVDSILIDESRTPLIISGPADIVPDKYRQADLVAKKLVRDEHYEVKEKERQVSLKEAGIEAAEKILGIDSFFVPPHTDWPHYIENALRANQLYEKDREYVIEEGEVVIVDEFTGRKMAGRRWSDGLHQAVEAKEGIRIKAENQTLATITYQNYFRLYRKLAGMTGTAMTEAGEFHKIYALDVVSIPTNLPSARADRVDVVYRTEVEKWKAIVDEIARLHEKGQPVLVGTTSVDNSEKLSGMLSRRGIPHEVLNAKNHAREAQIVALAGQRGAVTVSTNMAGRGTDIKLGGNFEYRLKQALNAAGLVEGDPEHLAEIDRIREEVRAQCKQDEQAVLAVGGLFVLGTERHEARRIDNQLRGRSGRQGDVGESRFYLSLQDPLMRRFYKDWVTNAMKRLGMEEGVPIESPMVTRAIARAQKKVEDYHFEIRKNLLEYDEVMDHQRKTIYGVRKEVLEGVDLKGKVAAMCANVTRRMAERFRGDADGFRAWGQRAFGFELVPEVARRATLEQDDDPEGAVEAVQARYDEREREFGEELARRIDRGLLLHAIDAKWMDHLRAIDALRHGIGLRGYAQKDPKNEYKAEGSRLFEKLFEVIEEEVASLILRVQVRTEPPGPAGVPGTTPVPQSPLAAMAQRSSPEAMREAQALMRARAAVARPPASAAFDRALRTGGVQRAGGVQREETAAAPSARSDAAAAAKPAAAPVPTPSSAPLTAGRNDPCPCGSGKKFKKCHGASA
jgi:preprotein translocase subunit SecA